MEEKLSSNSERPEVRDVGSHQQSNNRPVCLTMDEVIKEIYANLEKYLPKDTTPPSKSSQNNPTEGMPSTSTNRSSIKVAPLLTHQNASRETSVFNHFQQVAPPIKHHKLEQTLTGRVDCSQQSQTLQRMPNYHIFGQCNSNDILATNATNPTYGVKSGTTGLIDYQQILQLNCLNSLKNYENNTKPLSAPINILEAPRFSLINMQDNTKYSNLHGTQRIDYDCNHQTSDGEHRIYEGQTIQASQLADQVPYIPCTTWSIPLDSRAENCPEQAAPPIGEPCELWYDATETPGGEDEKLPLLAAADAYAENPNEENLEHFKDLLGIPSDDYIASEAGPKHGDTSCPYRRSLFNSVTPPKYNEAYISEPDRIYSVPRCSLQESKDNNVNQALQNATGPVAYLPAFEDTLCDLKAIQDTYNIKRDHSLKEFKHGEDFVTPGTGISVSCLNPTYLLTSTPCGENLCHVDNESFYLTPDGSTSYCICRYEHFSEHSEGSKISSNLTPGGSTSVLTPGDSTYFSTPGGSTSVLTPGGSTSVLTPGGSTSILTPGGSTTEFSSLIDKTSALSLPESEITSYLSKDGRMPNYDNGDCASFDTTHCSVVDSSYDPSESLYQSFYSPSVSLSSSGRSSNRHSDGKRNMGGYDEDNGLGVLIPENLTDSVSKLFKIPDPFYDEVCNVKPLLSSTPISADNRTASHSHNLPRDGKGTCRKHLSFQDNTGKIFQNDKENYPYMGGVSVDLGHALLVNHLDDWHESESDDVFDRRSENAAVGNTKYEVISYEMEMMSREAKTAVDALLKSEGLL